RQRDGVSLVRTARPTRAHQLGALLAPYSPAARVHPHGSLVAVVGIPADDGGVAVRRQRDGDSLGRRPRGTGAQQLGALLAPDSPAAGEHPRGARVAVVTEPADDGGLALPRQRDGKALGRHTRATRAHQLGALLAPDS